jgi:hypothetical protein
MIGVTSSIKAAFEAVQQDRSWAVAPPSPSISSVSAVTETLETAQSQRLVPLSGGPAMEEGGGAGSRAVVLGLCSLSLADKSLCVAYSIETAELVAAARVDKIHM